MFGTKRDDGLPMAEPVGQLVPRRPAALAVAGDSYTYPEPRPVMTVAAFPPPQAPRGVPDHPAEDKPLYRPSPSGQTALPTGITPSEPDRQADTFAPGIGWIPQDAGGPARDEPAEDDWPQQARAARDLLNRLVDEDKIAMRLLSHPSTSPLIAVRLVPVTTYREEEL